MKNNLKLITTETFGTVPCNFYRSINNDVLLTREQIGQALEYKFPNKSIYFPQVSNSFSPASTCPVFMSFTFSGADARTATVAS